MRLSVVVNTCALGPRAHAVTGSTTPSPHAWRAYALQHFILPAYAAHADEVIVVGEWREGEGYIYVSAPSVYFSAVDALHQRQAGFEMASGDVIIHVHDDHFLDPSALSEILPTAAWRADVLVPTRYRQELHAAKQHPTGMEDTPPYVGGHCAIYKREVLERCPWNEVPKAHVWDTLHTKMMRDAGFRLKEAPEMCVWDVEVAT